MTDHPKTQPCAWCDRQAKVYDVKPDGYVWYECEAKHLSLWSVYSKTTLFADDPRLTAKP